MFLRMKLSVAALAVSLSAFGGVALAQQTQTQTQPSAQNPAAGEQQLRRAGVARRTMQRRARQPMLRGLRQLNLTDQQKQQARSIRQTSLESNKAQRQELRQLTQQWRQGTLSPEGLARANELRKQFRAGREAMRGQLTGILTPEQKAKLEEMIKTRRANHELFRRQGARPN
jgi:Spy/CpxP family protein refolding chaperone